MKDESVEISIMVGLDDMAHNRLYDMVNDEFIRVANYGRRNPDSKCYCKELRKLGVRR